jgi:hypothetical protein
MKSGLGGDEESDEEKRHSHFMANSFGFIIVVLQFIG